MDSIRQVVSSRHGRPPEVWVADPDLYESRGRILRDSTTPRLLAYAPENRLLYVTDGCNSCAHDLPAALSALDPTQLQALADTTHIGLKLLGKMAEECAD